MAASFLERALTTSHHRRFSPLLCARSSSRTPLPLSSTSLPALGPRKKKGNASRSRPPPPPFLSFLPQRLNTLQSRRLISRYSAANGPL
ncbi:hypothetical protein PUN28_015842 [Cardiocondyla obscurior]|uniref:Uncharacterized protein n=1 Tax=Cardiocondyla obscurior TaxID=286306 RepID=A0AAW2ER63_9HYME